VLDRRCPERRREQLINGAFKWTSAHLRRKVSIQQKFDSGAFPFYCPGTFSQAAWRLDAGELLMQNTAHELARQRLKNYYFVDTINELRPKGLTNRPQYLIIRESAGIATETQPTPAMRGGAEIPAAWHIMTPRRRGLQPCGRSPIPSEPRGLSAKLLYQFYSV
jgi:hypothetical protein